MSTATNNLPTSTTKQKNQKPQQISKKSLKTTRSADQEYPAVYELSKDSFNGVTIRKVKPYMQEYQTFAKARWLNREIFEIVSKEFGSQLPSNWLKSIKNGNLKVNGKTITPTYVMKSGDHMVHRTHRHEPPVFGDISIVGETEDILAVNKPASMPMHPCGAYRHNSLLSILQNDLYKDREKAKDLRLVHRLDRVTSGLVIVAKSKDTAALLSEEIWNKSTQKVYLARVKGQFPAPQLLQLSKWESISLQPYLVDNDDNDDEDGEELDRVTVAKSTESTAPTATDSKQEEQPVVNKKKRKAPMTYKEENDTSSLLVPKVAATYEELRIQSDKVGYTLNETAAGREYWVSCPTGVLSHRDGVHACDVKGKPSLSIFRCLGYDAESDTSLIECQPVTGRTHQLRLHLQLCGTPIANDPCYGGELFFANATKKELALQSLARFQQFQVIPLNKIPHLLTEELAARQQQQQTSTCQDISTTSTALKIAEELENKSIEDTVQSDQRHANETEDEFIQRNCRYCQANQEIMQLEQYIHCDGIWLHAYRYSGKNWSFTTPWPAWSMAFPIATQQEPSPGSTNDNNNQSVILSVNSQHREQDRSSN